MMKNILLSVIVLILLTTLGYCQSADNLIEQAVGVYTSNVVSGGEVSGNNLIAGFSWGGLVGGFLFGSIGFVAFVYGKKNSEFKPMLMGLLLMGYPYFIKNTIAMYLVGLALTVALYLWRE